jgi:hypothetical protein
VRRDRALARVDLLAAAAAAAMILAVLLAAGRAALDRGRLDACAANVRQVVAGFAAYAAGCDGAIPPACNGLERGPYESYVAYEGGRKTDLRRVPWGPGYLYEQKSVADARAFYCPVGSGLRAHARNRSWTIAPGGARIRIGYLFFPYASPGAVAERPERIGDAEGDAVVLTDDILEGTSWHGGERWNVGAVDGSVRRAFGRWIVEDIDVASLPKGWLGHAWQEFRTVRARLGRR